MDDESPNSPIAHLLSGISWEGRKVNKKYRAGGRGVEEVLTTEVLLGLEFLPRRPFIKYFSDRITSSSSSDRFLSDEELDTFHFLSAPVGRHALRPNAPTHQAAIDVQIDAMAETDYSRIFIEAKRIRSSSFQEEQLARTFIVALREAQQRRPRMLLILGEPPPVKVKNLGRVEITDGIRMCLASVYKKTECIEFTLPEAEQRLEDCVGWITWHSIAEAVESAMREYDNHDKQTYASIQRIASFISESVRWHG